MLDVATYTGKSVRDLPGRGMRRNLPKRLFYTNGRSEGDAINARSRQNRDVTRAVRWRISQLQQSPRSVMPLAAVYSCCQ